MENNAEKRKNFRLNAYHLVKYRVSNALDKQLILASIKDISATGARLLVKEELPNLSQVEVLINFPWLDTPVSVVAKIVWVRILGRTKQFECGLEFVNLDDKIRKGIHERIRNAYQKE